MNKLTLAFSFILGLTTVTANAAMIDDFNGGDQEVTTAGNHNHTISYSPAFGGQRTINIEKTGRLEATSKVRAGLYAHNAESLTSATSTISWHSTTGVDLIEGRTTTNFALDILSIEQGDIDLVLSVTDFLYNSASFTLTSAGTGVNFIALTLFTGIDFLQITDISLEIVGDVALDLALNSISTVPTPSVLVLLGLGLAAFSFNRRITV